MKVLLILAHGSPRPEANEDVLKVAGEVRGRNAFPFVEVGYLDCNQPDIPAAIENCVRAGATTIIAVPYFLHSGKHFLKDVPELLDEATARHPGLTILMGDYLGHEPQLVEVLMDRVASVMTQ